MWKVRVRLGGEIGEKAAASGEWMARFVSFGFYGAMDIVIMLEGSLDKL